MADPMAILHEGEATARRTADMAHLGEGEATLHHPASTVVGEEDTGHHHQGSMDEAEGTGLRHLA